MARLRNHSLVGVCIVGALVVTVAATQVHSLPSQAVCVIAEPIQNPTPIPTDKLCVTKQRKINIPKIRCPEKGSLDDKPVGKVEKCNTWFAGYVAGHLNGLCDGSAESLLCSPGEPFTTPGGGCSNLYKCVAAENTIPVITPNCAWDGIKGSSGVNCGPLKDLTVTCGRNCVPRDPSSTQTQGEKGEPTSQTQGY